MKWRVSKLLRDDQVDENHRRLNCLNIISKKWNISEDRKSISIDMMLKIFAVLGIWGQVCDDGFGMIDADVICKELGFVLGALEVKPGGFYGNMDPSTRFMVDQLRCRGNETSLRECDFEG